jgi:hypothetical protein
MKHLEITVGEYTYGLPRFLLNAIGHGMQPIRYRMLKRMDPFNLSRIIFGTVLIKIIFQRLALICYKIYQKII